MSLFQDLYVEALYTLVHKVGERSNDFAAAEDDQLRRYVQAAFGVDDTLHRRLLEKANTTKVLYEV